jgi:hypothetical protein
VTPGFPVRCGFDIVSFFVNDRSGRAAGATAPESTWFEYC